MSYIEALKDGNGLAWPKLLPNQAGPSTHQLAMLAAKKLCCVRCCFFDAIRSGSGYEGWGECRRHAPQVLQYDVAPASGIGIRDGVFPRVRYDAWCGEFLSGPLAPYEYEGRGGDE